MKNASSGTFRRKTNFAAVSNCALKDNHLSLKAKGLYALIQSYITMPDKRLKKSDLIKKCKEGEKAFDTIWKELKETGYLKIYRSPTGEDDRFVYEYELLDESDLSRPALINLNKRGEVIPPKDSNKEENSHTPQKGGMRKSYPSSESQSNQSPESKTKETGSLAYPRNGGYANFNDDMANLEDSHTPHFAPYAGGTPCGLHQVPDRGNKYNTHDHKTHDYKIKSVSQSMEDQDGQTDSLREKLKEQIDYDYFEDNFPNDLSGVNALLDCMVSMLKSLTTRVGGYTQSRETLRPYIAKVDSEVVRGFLEHMRGKSMKGVRNINGYWQSALIDYVRGQELTLFTAD